MMYFTVATVKGFGKKMLCKHESLPCTKTNLSLLGLGKFTLRCSQNDSITQRLTFITTSPYDLEISIRHLVSFTTWLEGSHSETHR